MDKLIGRVSSLQSLGGVDGPGVRFVVFMQGCNLRCGYCHNPETWEICGGKEYTAAKLFEKIKKYKPYFGDKGGVTVSGGEALLQPEFVSNLFALCKKEGIHTCLDTSGSLWNEKIEQLLSVCDLVLLDIKMTDNEDYLKHIGCDIDRVLSFLNRLEEKQIKTWIRQVIVPTLNDSGENLQKLYEIVKGKKCIEKIELLPFKKLCVAKYENMGIAFKFLIYPQCEEDKTNKLQHKLDKLMDNK